MNRLYVGFSKQIELPEGGFLFIGDEASKAKGAKVFDPKKDSFNPLAHLDYRSAADFVDIIDSIFSRVKTRSRKTPAWISSPSASIGSLNLLSGSYRRRGKALRRAYMGARED
jgi:hypothetical protein